MSSKEKSADARFREAAEKMRLLETSTVVTADTLVHELPLFKCLEFGEPARRDLLEKYVDLGRQETSVTLVQVPKAQQFHETADEQLAATLLLANKVGAAKTDKTARKIKNRIMQTNDVVVQCQSVFYACSNVCDESINITVLLQRELILSIELGKQFDQLEVARSKQASARDSKAITTHGKEVRSLERKVERNRIQLAELEKTLHTELQRARTEYFNHNENWGVLKNIDKDVWTVVLTPVFRRLAFAKLLLAEAITELERLQLERTRIPHQRDELQAEIAKIANKQYRQLARKFHTDKGGEKGKFDEIKLAQRVITDTAYKDAKSGKSNLLMDYINRRDHKEFMDLLGEDEAKEAKAGVSATIHAKKKVSGKYVDDEKASQRNRASARDPRLMLEGGIPPKSKKAHVKETTGNSPAQTGRSHLQVSWGPGSHLSTKYELYVRKVGTDKWPVTYTGDRDYTQLRMRFPGIYEACVRGGNTHGWGEIGMESTFELDNKGRLVTEGDGLEEDPAVLARQRAHTAKATNLNMLKRVVNRVKSAVGKVLHQQDRPQAIQDLKKVVLASKQYQTTSEQHLDLISTARELLVALRRKELTKEWRNELKLWSDQIIANDMMSLDEIELEVRIRLRSLDPDRLNWFLQYQLTGCKKLTDSYRGDLATMPTHDRHNHRQLGCILAQIRESDELTDKLKDDFGRRIKDLAAALDRSEALEEEQRRKEVELEVRRLQREKVWEADRERREQDLANQMQAARQRTVIEEQARQARLQQEQEEASQAIEMVRRHEEEAAAAAEAHRRLQKQSVVPVATPRMGNDLVGTQNHPHHAVPAPVPVHAAPMEPGPAAVPTQGTAAKPAMGGRGVGRGRRRGRGGARTRLERPPPNVVPLPMAPPPVSVVTSSKPPGLGAGSDAPMMPPYLPAMLPPMVSNMNHLPQMQPPLAPPVLPNAGLWTSSAPSAFPTDSRAPGSSALNTFVDRSNGDTFGTQPPQQHAEEDSSGGLLDHRIREFLTDSQMMQYAEIFSDNEIDYDTLVMLEATDLATMGITKLGPQKKLLRGIEQLKNGKPKPKPKAAANFDPRTPEFSPQLAGAPPPVSGADAELTSILGSGWDGEGSTKVWGDTPAAETWGGGGGGGGTGEPGSLWSGDGGSNAAPGAEWEKGHADPKTGWSDGTGGDSYGAANSWSAGPVSPLRGGGLYGVGIDFAQSPKAPAFGGKAPGDKSTDSWKTYE